MMLDWQCAKCSAGFRGVWQKKCPACGEENHWRSYVLPDAKEWRSPGEKSAAGSPEHIMQLFAYEHLPAHLQAVSKPFCELARAIAGEEGDAAVSLPRNPERTEALRKLLESKDAAVHALLAGLAPRQP